MTGCWRASHGDLKEEQTPQLFNTPLARGGTKLPGGVTLITRSPAGGSAADASFKDPAASSPRAERSDVMRVHVRGRERATTPPPPLASRRPAPHLLALHHHETWEAAVQPVERLSVRLSVRLPRAPARAHALFGVVVETQQVRGGGAAVIPEDSSGFWRGGS